MEANFEKARKILKALEVKSKKIKIAEVRRVFFMQQFLAETKKQIDLRA